jgi:hypothetical protein
MAVAVLFLSAIVGVLHASEASADWPTTAATLCWSVGSGTFIKARITPEGGNFYTVNSIIVSNGSIHNVQIGTAYTRGDLVYWTTAGAGKDSIAMWTGQSYLVINRYTLAGKIKSIGHDKNFADGSLDTEYSAEPINPLIPVSCPSIWQ